MASFPYMSNPSRVKEFIQAIPGMGVPSKVTYQFIESVGFKSKNDRPILTALKALGFIDSGGVPTATWRDYRNKSQSGAVMAVALRLTYKGLFVTYPDAPRKDNEALRNYFSSHTTVGEGALKYMVGTFKSLAELADFDAESPLGAGDRPMRTEEEHQDDDQLNRRIGTKTASSGAGCVSININIQLQIPDTDKTETYDNFFAALKKHLLI